MTHIGLLSQDSTLPQNKSRNAQRAARVLKLYIEMNFTHENLITKLGYILEMIKLA